MSGLAGGVARRPRWQLHAAIVLALCTAFSVWALGFDWTALSDSTARGEAVERSRTFLSAFGAPDLSSERLRQGLSLSISTFSIAWWGSLLGLALGYLLALASSTSAMVGEQRRGAAAFVRRGLVELARFTLDVLRGVPDFAWALLVLTVPGPGAVTGVIAVGLGMAGMLGKIFGELWDAIPSRRVEALRSTGASRLSVVLYGLEPLSARAMLSYTLMRLECSVRNSSVIGVVGGGGLGAQLFDEFNYGNHAGVVTLLLFLFALTAGTDLASNFLRHQLREDRGNVGQAARGEIARGESLRRARSRRRLALGAIAAISVACLWALSPEIARAHGELDRVEWDFIREQLGLLARPEMRARTWIEALDSCRVPLAVAFLSTAIGVVGAALLAFPASLTYQWYAERFSGERPNGLRKVARGALVIGARSTSLVLRSVPEVAWLFIFAAFFRIGTLPGVIAVGVHSIGVLARVFVESVDNLPLRASEVVFRGSRLSTFLYATVPSVAREWASYSFLQLETNVRAGLVVGIVGIGGLGERFHTSLQGFNLPRAAVFLIFMVLLTTLLDRASRALRIGAGSVY